MIRVFDVAFDGYNGGMDQSAVDWGNPSSTQAFMQNSFNRSQPYHGDSMLVMALPNHPEVSKKAWPNPASGPFTSRATSACFALPGFSATCPLFAPSCAA